MRSCRVVLDETSPWVHILGPFASANRCFADGLFPGVSRERCNLRHCSCTMNGRAGCPLGTQPFPVLKTGVELSALSYFAVAFTAVYRPLFSGLKRHFSFLATLGAYGGEHLAWGAVVVA